MYYSTYCMRLRRIILLQYGIYPRTPHLNHVMAIYFVCTVPVIIPRSPGINTHPLVYKYTYSTPGHALMLFLTVLLTI